jgi:hypothetical protein
MRKLLLGTTSLAAAATLSANAALADISISGYYEWKYQSRSSNITTNDGTTFASDSEIKFTFSNKTDSGLDIAMVTELESDDTDTAINESSISIAGGFGKLVLGGNDSVGDDYGIEEGDIVSEEILATGVDSLTLLDSDIAGMEGDANKVSYHIPAMGGLTAGVSFADSGATGASDTTTYGAQYAMSAGGASITLGGATATTENSTQDIDSQNVGMKVVTGNVTFIASQATYEASSTDETGTGAGISFKVNDAMTIGVFTTEVEDDTSSEEYTNTGAEVKYSIASGLTAFINVEDYDYKVGTSTSTTADSGTVSKLTIKATF